MQVCRCPSHCQRLSQSRILQSDHSGLSGGRCSRRGRDAQADRTNRITERPSASAHGCISPNQHQPLSQLHHAELSETSNDTVSSYGQSQRFSHPHAFRRFGLSS